MVSLERQRVNVATREVFCPLRDTAVALSKCLACGRLTKKDEQDPPRYIVCDARIVTGWLGLDDL